MRVRTFVAKSNLDGIAQCDEQINDWIEREGVEILFVKQSSGFERHHGQNDDPVVVMSVWYNKTDEF